MKIIYIRDLVLIEAVSPLNELMTKELIQLLFTTQKSYTQSN